MALNTLFARKKSDNNQKNIIVLAGLRCSGKTFIRKLILNYFDFDFYHTNRVKTGDHDSMAIGPKEIVQRYGKGESYFYYLKDDIINFYNSSNKSIVIDSIKCINDINVLQDFFPNSKIHVVWTQAKDSIRLERYEKRDIERGVRNSNLFDHDKELIELGILEVIKNVDFIINTDDTHSNILHQISTFLIPLK
jgi:dephospho-CoA kinase